MLFRQLFDKTSSTYTYLLASRHGGEALLIDPVFEQTNRYLKLLEELDLKLVKVIDTHIHADHVSAMGKLRDVTRCTTVMGEQSPADVVSMRVCDNDPLTIEGLTLTALHTPGHTSESYSFLMGDRVFTGDTLLIRGTGRTDFQNGDPYDQYHSLFERLLKLPEQTFVYPGHDYKGDTVSTIGEEKAFNPRLNVNSVEEYAEIMNNLNLPNPKMMDVAVPENLRLGLRLEAQHRVPSIEVEHLLETWPNVQAQLVDIRFPEEVAAWSMGFSTAVPLPELPARLEDLDRSKIIVTACPHKDRAIIAMVYCFSLFWNSGVTNESSLPRRPRIWPLTNEIAFFILEASAFSPNRPESSSMLVLTSSMSFFSLATMSFVITL